MTKILFLNIIFVLFQIWPIFSQWYVLSFRLCNYVEHNYFSLFQVVLLPQVLKELILLIIINPVPHVVHFLVGFIISYYKLYLQWKFFNLSEIGKKKKCVLHLLLTGLGDSSLWNQLLYSFWTPGFSQHMGTIGTSQLIMAKAGQWFQSLQHIF